ncbi:MAG: hypothetical protein HN423_03240 [Alphaproteobacteria bacterium]|nr:hypothetical protein [Alphaproteobacteria bacterium]
MGFAHDLHFDQSIGAGNLRVMNKHILGGCLLVLSLTSCTMPGLQIREVYWGKQILERSLFDRTITYDGQGNPVFDERGPLFVPPPAPDPDAPDVDDGP